MRETAEALLCCDRTVRTRYAVAIWELLREIASHDHEMEIKMLTVACLTPRKENQNEKMKETYQIPRKRDYLYGKQSNSGALFDETSVCQKLGKAEQQ